MFTSGVSDRFNILHAQAGLVGNRAISPAPWNIVTSLERAFPLLLGPAADAARSAAERHNLGGSPEALLKSWVTQVLHPCALSSSHTETAGGIPTSSRQCHTKLAHDVSLETFSLIVPFCICGLGILASQLV